MKTNSGGGAWTSDNDQIDKDYFMRATTNFIGIPALVVGGMAAADAIKHKIDHSAWGTKRRWIKHLKELQRKSPLP